MLSTGFSTFVRGTLLMLELRITPWFWDEALSRSKDKKHDKYLPSILTCPAYQEEDFKTGNHLKDLKLIMEPWRDKVKYMKNQEVPRFHYLKPKEDLGVPSLFIDFKHYFTLPRSELYKLLPDHYVCSIEQFHREELTRRFASYLSRIGIPNEP